jgi:outer membrane protein OmpA-like peptidoglycan-associated protein
MTKFFACVAVGFALATTSALIGCTVGGGHEPRVRHDVGMLQGLEAIQSRESARGIVLTVPDRLFDADRPELKPDARRELAAVAVYLKEHRERRALIEGHTDDSGDDARNRDVSLKRGTAVETFLLKNGVDPERMEVRGLGAAQPIASNDSRSGRRQNRRVEIVLVN